MKKYSESPMSAIAAHGYTLLTPKREGNRRQAVPIPQLQPPAADPKENKSIHWAAPSSANLLAGSLQTSPYCVCGNPPCITTDH